jgi:membrane fusion protein, multidrug efflux system
MKSRYSALTFVLMLIGVASACSRATPGKAVSDKRANPAGVKVNLVTVDHREQRRTVEAVGSLFALDEVTVSSEVEGRVEQVLVDVGDRVSKGQVLARVSPVELQLTVDQQNAALAQSRARLGLRPGETELKDPQQAAEVKKAAADLSDAEQRYKRAQGLLETGVIARQVFDEAEARYMAAKAAYDLAVQQVENMRASMHQNQAALNLANKKLRDAHIYAPFAGHVKVRSVTTGQYLKVQAPVMTIVNIDPLRVRLSVPEKMSPWVGVGREVSLSLEAFPGRTFAGKISRINPTVDEKTRTFEIEGLVSNPRGELKPGSFVKAAIPSDKVDSVLTIPQTAAVYLFGAYKVFVVDGNRLKEIEIKLGEQFGDQVEVIEGLKAQDRIAVAENGQALRDGMELDQRGKEVVVH